MLIMDNWGHAYENMNSAARELHERYRQFCNGCSKVYDDTCSKEDALACNEKRIALMKEMLDISDIRLFCVVTYDDEGVQRVRHIFRVEEQSLRCPHQLRENLDKGQLPLEVCKTVMSMILMMVFRLTPCG